MEKICPVCGKKYHKSDNFCSKHSKLVKLVEIRDLVKICPRCGQKYLEDDNFCGMHDEAIELCYITDLVKQCMGCGAKYPKEYNYCIKCEWDDPLVVIGRKDIDVINIPTSPNKTFNYRNYLNHYDTVETLFSSLNIELLKEFNFTEVQFDEIIENIIKVYKSNFDKIIKDYYIDYRGISLLDKILIFSKSIVKTEYKGGGGDYGHYLFNEIYVGDRSETALKIVTIIHELSHFLLSEILEQIVSTILNTDKTEILEAYVHYVLTDSFNHLIDEYCAHTVESRFAMMGFNDFNSYKQALREFVIDHGVDYVEPVSLIGNTFAKYVLMIIESFIDYNMRQEIIFEFSTLESPNEYEGLAFEMDETLDWYEFKKFIRIIGVCIGI